MFEVMSFPPGGREIFRKTEIVAYLDAKALESQKNVGSSYSGEICRDKVDESYPCSAWASTMQIELRREALLSITDIYDVDILHENWPNWS